MAELKSKSFVFAMLFSLFFAVLLTLQGVAASRSIPVAVSSDTRSTFSSVDLQINFPRREGRMRRDLMREMIGSVAPTCSYNECRGCKFKCRAEQVPVEGNDPMNSPYHYKCVCHK